METLSELQDVFRETFQDDEIAIAPETTAADIEAWDSLMHVTLMVNVESHFGIRLSSAQVASLKNVGELVGLVESAKSGG